MKKRFTEEQIIGFLREAEAGLPIKELCRRHGFSEASYYLWRSKFGGMSVSDAKRLKELEAGQLINHKRVDRLYAEAGLQVRRRRRKKVPVADRQPLGRPLSANQVWSMDFVFDRTADGRVIKSLTMVEDATHESVAIVPERAIGGHALTRILDRLALERGLPQAIRTDNGKEFCGRSMLNWAHACGVKLFLIEPGKPNQNACIESFNGRFRDECLNEQWFISQAHARAVIEAWRREYNEERPKKLLSGLTPSAYARQLAGKSATLTTGL